VVPKSIPIALPGIVLELVWVDEGGECEKKQRWRGLKFESDIYLAVESLDRAGFSHEEAPGRRWKLLEPSRGFEKDVTRTHSNLRPPSRNPSVGLDKLRALTIFLIFH
jgi:hypothetical protein